MADMPVCGKCSKPHWRFVSCDDAPAEQQKREQAVAQSAAAYPIKSVPEGFRPWGDQLHTRDRNGWLIPDKKGL